MTAKQTSKLPGKFPKRSWMVTIFATFRKRSHNIRVYRVEYIGTRNIILVKPLQNIQECYIYKDEICCGVTI